MRTGRRNNLRRLNLCFSSFTQPFAPANSSPQLLDHNRPSLPTTAPATSPIMINNFNTLYDHHHTLTLQCSSSSHHDPFEPEPESEPADFATAFASQRFFFSSPGRSNSIVESTNTDTGSSSSSSSLTATAPAPEIESAGADSEKRKAALKGSVAVPTYSVDPYVDFRRSMQEMVEARPELMKDVKSNWEALHELLLCYLALNPKSTHKFILGAFSDLLVTLMPFPSSSSSSHPPPPPPPNLNPNGGGGCC